MSSYSPDQIAAATELTLVRPDATRAQIEQLCQAAIQRRCHGVCVNSSRVADAYAFAADAGLKVVSTIGFPFGAADSDAKRYEVECAIDAGAHELDAVLNLGFLKDDAHEALLRELRDIVEAADERPVKFLVDVSLLTEPETNAAIQLILDSGAQFISISAEIERVKKLADAFKGKFQIKAFASQMSQATRLLEAGAARIGQVSA